MLYCGCAVEDRIAEGIRTVPKVHHLVYVSTARLGLTDQDLEELLIQARDRNRKLGITGMLIFGAGNFIQALEGDEAAVRAVFASIVRDQRHSGIITMVEFTDTHRDFPDWGMAYAHEPHQPKIQGCINTLDDQRRALDRLPDGRFIGQLLAEFLKNNR